MSFARDTERIDDLMYKGLRIIQNPSAFCFGTDAVLLSSFAVIHKGDTVVDFCTGTGIIPILLAGREKAHRITGIEIQKDIADMAKRSVELNALTDMVDIIEGDVRQAPAILNGVCDVVTVNPPYEKAGGKTNANEYHRISRHEVLCTLDDIAGNASRVLKYGGRFYIIYRTARFVELVQTMAAYKLEPKKIRLVHPTYGKEPNYVLVEGKKGAGKGVVFLKPLIVYGKDGEYTQEVKKIYHLD